MQEFEHEKNEIEKEISKLERFEKNIGIKINSWDVIVEEEDMIENPSAISDNMSALKRIRDVRLGLQKTMLTKFNHNSKSKYNH